MPHDMISRDDFAVLLERTGLILNDDQFEAARASYANLRALTDLVRIPRDRRVESPHILRLREPEELQNRLTVDHPYRNTEI